MAAPDLRDRLAELEFEHATLQGELQAFYAEYLARVGVIELELQALQQRTKAPPVDVGDPGATTATLEFEPAPAPPPADEEIKRLFRDAAKRIHPDLQPEPTGRAHAEAFMKRLNEAYAARDADAMANLVRQWETSPYATTDTGSPALAAAVEQAEARLAQTRASDLARLMEQTFRAQMEGRDLLQELRWRAQEALAAARALDT